MLLYCFGRAYFHCFLISSIEVRIAATVHTIIGLQPVDMFGRHFACVSAFVFNVIDCTWLLKGKRLKSKDGSKCTNEDS